MEHTNFVLSGLGGQGILFMTKLMARTAVSRGLNIMVAETHGMAQRGGSVVSHLRIGDVEGSLVRAGSAHIVLSLDENEAYRNIPFLARRGRLYVNAREGAVAREEVRSYLDRMEMACHFFPASATAVALGAPRSSNLALLGFFSAFQDGLMGRDGLRKTIAEVSPERFRDINLKVFDRGFQRGAGERETE
ncbi:MAG: indolepyruvate oxidoreductase subunit beta [Deltaproteobacteria bacterium]|nr:indolepyruvate oxidoreductase subunit beta [Deltaproteobacteria bacterium]